MTRKKIEKLIEKWKDCLLLEDYSVSYDVKAPGSYSNPEDVHHHENASITTVPSDKTARITFNRNSMSHISETVVVHELTHILFARLDIFINEIIKQKRIRKKYTRIVEEIVDDIVKILLRSVGRRRRR